MATANADEDEEHKYFLEMLPNLPMEMVCKALPLVDVIDMSMVSPRVRLGIENINLKVNRLEVAFDSQDSYILLKMGDKSLKWSFTVPDGLEMNTHRQFGRYNYRCAKTETGFYTNHYDIEHGIPTVLGYFVTLFDCNDAQISLLSIDLSVVAEFRSVIETFRHFTKINRIVLKRSGAASFDLTLGTNVQTLLRKFEINEAHIAVNTEVADECALFAQRPALQRFDKLLKMDHVYIEFAEWITPVDLANMSVKTIVLDNHRFTAADINVFIKDWLASTDNRLMWIEFKAESFSANLVVKGIDGVVSDRIRATLHSIHHCNAKGVIVPITFGEQTKQITRADGTIAQISVSEESVFFFVKDDGHISMPEPQAPEAPVNGEAQAIHHIYAQARIRIAIEEDALMRAREERDRLRQDNRNAGRQVELIINIEERIQNMRADMMRRLEQARAAQARLVPPPIGVVWAEPVELVEPVDLLELVEPEEPVEHEL